MSSATNKNYILYLGDDTNYYENLKKRYSKYFSALAFEHVIFNVDSPGQVQSLVLKVLDIDPKIVFIDLSKHFENYLHLARVLARLNSTKKKTVIGLLDQNQSDRQVKESYLSGLLVCHVKSSEIHDVVFDSVAMCFPEKTPEHGFVRADLGDIVNIYELAKVGFVTQNSIHIECNRPITSGSNVIINHYWFENKIIPSQRFVVTKKSDKGLFYNYNHALDLEFMFIDPYVPVEGDDDEYIHQRQIEDEEKIDEAMENLDAWIKEALDASFPKIMRVLVIDKQLKLIADQERTDSYTFMLRTQPFMDQPAAELKKLTSQIIFFEHHRNEEGEEGPENSYSNLKEMVIATRDIPNYEPFFIVLNTRKEMSSKLRADYNYEQIICHESKVNKEIVIQMSKMLETKVNANYKVNDDVPTIYLKKSNSVSIAELVFPITIVKLSETDLMFTSQVPMKPFTTFRLEIPANMYVTIVPNGIAEKDEFYGLIHGISEIEKMKLRQFINSVFFREKEAEKQRELEEIESKKKQALEEKEKLKNPPPQEGEEDNSEENPNPPENGGSDAAE